MYSEGGFCWPETKGMLGVIAPHESRSWRGGGGEVMKGEYGTLWNHMEDKGKQGV
jgi:hypothetical protein